MRAMFRTAIFILSYLIFFAALAQDSVRPLLRHKTWIELHGGPSVLNAGGATILAPGISLGKLSERGKIIRLKVAYHEGLNLFANFAARNAEANFMFGQITRDGDHLLETYYGVGLMIGEKRGDEISSGLLYTRYERIRFSAVCLPLEIRLQWPVFGIGIDASINAKVPYLGLKYFLRLRCRKEEITKRNIQVN
jgi:hypothetical protein